MAAEWRDGVLCLEGENYTMVTGFDGTPTTAEGYFVFSRDSGKNFNGQWAFPLISFINVFCEFL